MKNLRMKSARAALDMSQQQLADAVGVTRQTINAIERGDYNPTIKLCLAICKALGKPWTSCSGSKTKFMESIKPTGHSASRFSILHW